MLIIVDLQLEGWIAKFPSGQILELPHPADADQFAVAGDVQAQYPDAMVCFLRPDPLGTVGTRD